MGSAITNFHISIAVYHVGHLGRCEFITSVVLKKQWETTLSFITSNTYCVKKQQWCGTHVRFHYCSFILFFYFYFLFFQLWYISLCKTRQNRNSSLGRGKDGESYNGARLSWRGIYLSVGLFAYLYSFPQKYLIRFWVHILF